MNLLLIFVLCLVAVLIAICLIPMDRRWRISNPTKSLAETYLLPRKFSFTFNSNIQIDDKGLFIDRSRFEFGWPRVFFVLKNYSIDDLLRRRVAQHREYLCTTRRLKTFEDTHINSCNSLDEQVEVFRRYTFAIVETFEDLIAAFLAGCIPIAETVFFEGNRIELRDFNPKSFVHPRTKNLDIVQLQSAPVISEQVLKARLAQIIAISRPFQTKQYKPIMHWRSSGAEYIVINLNEHKIRLYKIAQQFKNTRRTFERFPAIKGKTVAHKFVDKIKWEYFPPIRNGQLGIYLSDMEICSSLVQEPPDIDFYAILEDDVSFQNNFIPDPASIVFRAPKDWDMIFLGVNKNWCKVDNTAEFVKLTEKCMPGAFAFIIRKRFAKYLVNFFEPIEYPIDQVYRRETSWFNIYAVNPIVAEADYTVISSTNSNE